MNKNSLMFKLNPEFQREIFQRVIKKYKISTLASKELKIPASSLRGYKNLHYKSVRKELIDKLINLKITDIYQVKTNTISIFNKENSIKTILDNGRKIRHRKIEFFKKEIPKIEDLIINNNILLEKWFNKYINLINFGARQFKNISKNENKIRLVYTNYANSKKKKFINYLPAKIKIDKDFQYFFGLWCGDRLGSGRFGVANKTKEINFYTKYYLRVLYQEPEFILIYNNGIKEPILDYKIDKTYINKTETKIKGYCVHVGIKNRIMFTFFDYLYKNLDQVVGLLPNKNIFFAGLFDAEGNVFLEGNCFRWSCLDKEKVEIYKKYLNELKLFKRYDGGNLVTDNKDVFARDILPYIKSKEKINKTKLICYGIGKLEKRFVSILEIIENNPGIVNSSLSKVLKRDNRYNQTRFLEKLGYIETRNYPKQLYLTIKGYNEIWEGR